MHTKYLLTYSSHHQYIKNDQSQYTGSTESLLGMIFVTFRKERRHVITISLLHVKLPSLWPPLITATLDAILTPSYNTQIGCRRSLVLLRLLHNLYFRLPIGLSLFIFRTFFLEKADIIHTSCIFTTNKYRFHSRKYKLCKSRNRTRLLRHPICVLYYGVKVANSASFCIGKIRSPMVRQKKRTIKGYGSAANFLRAFWKI